MAYVSRDTLYHAVTEWDRRQETRKGYNRHALPIYLDRVNEVVNLLAEGKPPREAILTHFNDRLADFLLKAIGEPKATVSDRDAQNLRSIANFRKAYS